MWFLDEIHSAMVTGLSCATAALEAEQAVRGIDALDELALHAVVAQGVRAGGFGVHREVRYPSDRGSRRRSEGRRCDLVITPQGSALDENGSQLSLLRSMSVCPLEEALWVEVKMVAQFVEERPNPSYGAALQGPIWRDLQKLGADPRIQHAAQLVILFTATAEVASHDLAVTLDRAWSRGLRLDTPRVDGFAIGDRFGNSYCTAALVRVVY